MRKNAYGFTVVELLLVITVIAILATVSIVAYNESQTRAQNASRLAELKAWQKAFVQYKAANGGNLPAQPVGGYCLGTGFPTQKCRDWQNTVPGGPMYTEASSVNLMNALSTYDPPKVTSHVPVTITIGPYVKYETTYVRMFAVFKGGPSDCPAGTIYDWHDPDGRLLCYVRLDTVN